MLNTRNQYQDIGVYLVCGDQKSLHSFAINSNPSISASLHPFVLFPFFLLFIIRLFCSFISFIESLFAAVHYFVCMVSYFIFIFPCEMGLGPILDSHFVHNIDIKFAASIPIFLLLCGVGMIAMQEIQQQQQQYHHQRQ